MKRPRARQLRLPKYGLINIPNGFLRLLNGFWGGSDEQAGTLEIWIRNGARLLPIADVPTVRDFLRKLLALNPTNADLIRLCAEGGSSYGLLDTPDTRRIFDLLLAEMEKRAAAGR